MTTADAMPLTAWMWKAGTCSTRDHRPSWYVQQRECNYSAFNGGHWTPSAYSSVRCPVCRFTWRTRAGYVATLPDAEGPKTRLAHSLPGTPITSYDGAWSYHLDETAEFGQRAVATRVSTRATTRFIDFDRARRWTYLITATEKGPQQ